jgi:hypothetical protein
MYRHLHSCVDYFICVTFECQQRMMYKDHSMTCLDRHRTAAEVSFQPLYPWEIPIVQEAEWASEPVWTGIQSPDRPARSESLYPVLYPGRPIRRRAWPNLKEYPGMCLEGLREAGKRSYRIVSRTSFEAGTSQIQVRSLPGSVAC